jgi:sortase A
LSPQRSHRSRAVVLLLFFVFLVLPACGGASTSGNAEQPPRTTGTTAAEAGNAADTTAPDEAPRASEDDEDSGDPERTVAAVLPEDLLSEEERTGTPEFREWDDEGGDVPAFANTSNTSVGTIPAVKPFNFGRDPGGPEDKTLYLTVPRLGLEDVPVFDSLTEEKLRESVVHVPATGFPWQEGANTYIAGHRLGYEGTGSDRIFYDLDQLAAGDGILLEDAAGGQYYYRVTEQKVVGPENVEVMNAVPGRSLVTLQTCTLPDYSERIVVQGELVDKNA